MNDEKNSKGQHSRKNSETQITNFQNQSCLASNQKNSKIKLQQKINQEKNRTSQNIQLIDNERKKQIPTLNLKSSPILVRRQVQASQKNDSQNNIKNPLDKSKLEDNRNVSMNSFALNNQIKKQSKYVKEVRQKKNSDQLQKKLDTIKKLQEIKMQKFKKYRLSRILSNEIFIVFVLIFGIILYNKITSYLTSQNQIRHSIF